eukprot:Awhi_evm1s9521
MDESLEDTNVYVKPSNADIGKEESSRNGFSASSSSSTNKDGQLVEKKDDAVDSNNINNTNANDYSDNNNVSIGEKADTKNNVNSNTLTNNLMEDLNENKINENDNDNDNNDTKKVNDNDNDGEEVTSLMKANDTIRNTIDGNEAISKADATADSSSTPTEGSALTRTSSNTSQQ